MKRLNCEKTRLVLIGFAATIVLGVGSVKADFTFGEPVNLGPVINRRNDYGACLSADGLSLFFQSDWPNGGQRDLWVSIRETPHADWAEPVKLGPAVNTSSSEMDPSISGDGLELYFSRGADLTIYTPRGGDLFVTTRDTRNDEWEDAVSLGETVNSSDADGMPSVSADGLSLYFQSDRPGGEGGPDLYVTTRPTRNDPWSTPINLGPIVNSSANDLAPSITSDGLSLIFSSNRSGKYSSGSYPDLWVTTRTTTSDPWQEPINLGPIINTDDVDFARISPDGTTLFLSCWQRPGGYGIGKYDIWQAPVSPVVDFNSDGIIDSADMCIMVDHWGEDYPLCDVGPMPWGDGVVDVQDLKILAEHLFEEVFPVELIGYWKLDEAEGDIAYNSVSDSHGVLSGNPTWQPESGQVDGALQFDGIDDYISTDFVLNPGFTEFSVFAWIQGGSPGQVIISQKSGFGNVGATWLGLDASDGRLITELTSSAAGPLESETVITDGQWHHIGFVWDGSYRALYVDGIEVTKDTVALTTLKSSTGGMYIGVGKDRASTSFFSGLIDDIRIYNRVVSP